ncbi:hypothetical protein [Pseudanabaena sp. 'Roaring Creek']|uniref:hypothetical protein n=1 Tax=Pseudanabaena sp. 'Roaring Creek' TaxID=1681830 RepID=UPI0006D76DFA|nr:hypothetical protein [Pseudanabaena sp. 'Roaring Creek']
MTTEVPKKRGNPTFKAVWSQPADKVIRIPEYLADTLLSLARQVDGGKIKQAQLNQLCLNPDDISQELTAITGKPALSIAPVSQATDNAQLLEKIEEFEAAQRAAWGTLPQHRGEFSTDSARWAKYHEFKDWLARQK